MFGLDPDTIRNIKQAIAKIPDIDKAILYGSRAKGNYRNGSDIDITLLGKNLTLNNSVYPLMDALEELYLPYMFDISIFSNIDNENLIEHIHQVGKVFYQREKELPKGWEIKKLGEVCEIRNGLWRGKKPPFIEVGVIRNTNFTKEGRLDDSNIASLPVEIKQFEKRKLEYGDIILEKSGGGPKQPVGRVVLFDKPNGSFSFSNFTSAIRILDKDILEFNFLHKFLFFLHVSGKTEPMQRRSTGIRNLQLKEYKEVIILFPSLPEQKRIVAILDQALTAINKVKANTEQNLKNARELFQSQLQTEFATGKLKIKSGEWQEKRLGDVCLVERGSSPRPIAKYITDNEDGVNWIKIGDAKMVDKYIYKTNQKITVEGARKSRYVKVGDFILSNSMSYGKPYIMKTDGYIHDGWFVLRLHDFIHADYFFILLSSSYISEQFNKLASGSVVKNISGDLVKKVVLPIPPLKEQKCMVKELDALATETKKLEAIYNKKLYDLDELKKSILQQAFNGEL